MNRLSRARRLARSVTLGLAAATGVLTFSGCAPTTPQWDKRFGESVRQMRQQQVRYPEAGGDAMVQGVDGVAAREAIVNYRDSFRQPPASTGYTSGLSR